MPFAAMTHFSTNGYYILCQNCQGHAVSIKVPVSKALAQGLECIEEFADGVNPDHFVERACGCNGYGAGARRLRGRYRSYRSIDQGRDRTRARASCRAS